MKKILLIFTLMFVFMMLACSFAYAADDVFDVEQIDKGIIGVSYKSDSSLKVQITIDKKSYTYNLNKDGKKEYFSLQMGNGKYKITLLQNTTGSAYKLVTSTNVDLKLDDPNVVYLGSVQNVNWAVNPKTIEKAVALTKDIKDLKEKAKALWDFVVANNEYDNNKLATLPATYLPVPDTTLKDKTGICYDFSALYASMLRSEGIPAKLVKGYAPDYATGYHAWNEVYDKDKKEWIVIDSTYDIQINSKKLPVEMKKDASGFKKVHEY